MTLSPEILSLAALGISLVSLVFTVLIYVRVSKFFKGSGDQSFEGTARTILEDIDRLQNFERELTKYIEILEKGLGRSTQTTFSKRYNPFKGTGEGGLQSHSTAFLSERGDGVILSSLTTRDRVSVFAKPIKNFSAVETELTPEEKEVLQGAREAVSL